jgi:hypothetical protein
MFLCYNTQANINFIHPRPISLEYTTFGLGVVVWEAHETKIE